MKYVIALVFLVAACWNIISCCGPDRIVKADEGTFYVPADAMPFGSFHIYEENGGDTWWLWIDSSDRVTIVHHARLVGYRR